MVRGYRVLVLGNSGSGKTTLARRLAAEHGLAHLDLDAIAWAEPGVRRPLEASVAELEEWLEAHPRCVVEGCYASLAAAAAPACDELHFLNPGVETCVANCRARPWEPAKYDSPEAQDEVLSFLLDWVRAYPTRDDEYGLAAHRALYDAFEGDKYEVRSL